MTPTLSLHHEVNAATHKKSHAHHQMFSRASHFGKLLTPIALGVAYILVRERSAGLDSVSMGISLFAFLLFLIGVGSGIAILHSVNLYEDWEKRQK